jgi:MoaA/NifB/PqqE/SkfB family radical SAM enzyme
MKRAKGVMSAELFGKIIDDAAGIDKITKVTLTGLGEPLLDPQLMTRLKYVRDKMPKVDIDLYTNGALLKPEMTDALNLTGINTVNVSLNAVDARKRRDIMRLDDFEKVCGYIDYAIAHGKFFTVVKGIVTKDLMENHESEAFLRRWGGPTDIGGHAFLHLEGNWAGDTWPVRVKPTTPCSRALQQIMVLQDGRVSLCCFDGEGEVIFGDLRDQSLRDVFNGPLALEYRTAHNEGRRGEMKLCATCTAI